MKIKHGFEYILMLPSLLPSLISSLIFVLVFSCFFVKMNPKSKITNLKYFLLLFGVSHTEKDSDTESYKT